MSAYQDHYAQLQALVEQTLDFCIPLPETAWPVQGIPHSLAEAMRYSLLSGGKRIRPVLLLAAYQACQSDVALALPFAAAIECIHTYSLIHDDLPAMDDDDLRRGQPTSHKVFGEALAILAGDALLTLAFELMAGSTLPKSREAMRIIAQKSGPAGMIAGQVADMAHSGNLPQKEMVSYIHRHKTADLFIAPLLAGFTLGGADQAVLDKALVYGQALGLAFQITDDLLDLEGSQELTGKAGQRDQAQGKLTWPGAVGLEQARKDARNAVDEAVAAARAFGRNADFFSSLAISIPNRVK